MTSAERRHAATGPVGLDANIFVYASTGVSNDCRLLLTSIERGRLTAVTTHEVVHETLHRLMMLEAVQAGHISGRHPARELRDRPEVVRKLSRYYLDLAAFLSIGVAILPRPADLLQRSQPLRERYGLLTNDSLLAATLLASGVRTIATADRDFTRVKDLRVLPIRVNDQYV